MILATIGVVASAMLFFEKYIPGWISVLIPWILLVICALIVLMIFITLLAEDNFIRYKIINRLKKK